MSAKAQFWLVRLLVIPALLTFNWISGTDPKHQGDLYLLATGAWIVIAVGLQLLLPAVRQWLFASTGRWWAILRGRRTL